MNPLADPIAAGDMTARELAELRARQGVLADVDGRLDRARAEVEALERIRTLVVREQRGFTGAVLERLGLDATHRYHLSVETGAVTMVAVAEPVEVAP